MLIREIQLSDAEAFLHLLKQVDDSGYMLFAPGERDSNVETERKKIEHFLKESNSTIFVADTGNELVGYLMAKGNHLIRAKHSAYLVVGVHVNYRGQGIGKELFEELFIWARRLQLKRLELTAIQDNKNAVKLYQKMGFIIEGEKHGSLLIDGEAVDEYFMYKWL
ncbi:GNAT family N-acetyltransferase [Bacillus sp. 31A1R]|uniref:GNAT family N-acetyltransferase n=1 Tax=Robertmurraya mangrovi TaxID=3098077 RepID=A0ABU5J333_9BACI|nr:GNAT family N-acetyltransferase [Bacillus sp. 31A1R]MDZ5473814.1 GNAT family N-acetyltransferase [Bacillus sp. 31A1R]